MKNQSRSHSIRFAISISTILLGVVLIFQAAGAANHQVRNLLVSDGVDASIEQYPADGKYLLLWMASGFGFNKNQREMAQLLAKNGFETWMVDMAETLFLSRGSSALKEIPGKYVSEIIIAAHRLTGKKILLVSASHGAIPALRGAYHWQKSSPGKHYLLGAVLFSPNLFTTVPSLGQDPEYLPITSASNIPIYIFQGEKNGNRWQLETLRTKLQSGGSQVYIELMRGVTGIFYGEDRPPAYQEIYRKMPSRFRVVASLFEAGPAPLSNPNTAGTVEKVSKGLDIHLKKYSGNPIPRRIRLKDSNGIHHDINDYKGKVTIINFWATWCPPCIEEIPSLNRLKKKLHDIPFRLISIDYAENQGSIHAFLKKVQVEFTVLLDTDGKEASKWKVISFPSTFIIGPDGEIRYGVNAALEWDSPKIEKTIRGLLLNGKSVSRD